MVFPRIKELQKLQKPEKLERLRRNFLKDARNAPADNSDDCKQAISLSKGVYCGVWREKIDAAMCQFCPYFDREPSEYRLFKRT